MQAFFSLFCKTPERSPSEELKSAAKAGLKQIMDRQYDSKIKEYQHVKKILKVSMAFCGKEVVMQYQID